jgi:hypothetical protein
MIFFGKPVSTDGSSPRACFSGSCSRACGVTQFSCVTLWLPLAIQLRGLSRHNDRAHQRTPPHGSTHNGPQRHIIRSTAGDLACSGQGDGTLLISRRTGCCFRPSPKANSQIRSSNELNSRVFQRLPNLLNGIKVGLDATFRALQPAYGRKGQPGFPGKLLLPPSEERASCLDLSRVNEHLCPLIQSGNRCEYQLAGPDDLL